MTLCYIKSLELPSSHGQTIQGPLELYSYVKAGYEQGEFHPWTQSRISTETGNCQDVHTHYSTTNTFLFCMVLNVLNFLPTFALFKNVQLGESFLDHTQGLWHLSWQHYIMTCHDNLHDIFRSICRWMQAQDGKKEEVGKGKVLTMTISLIVCILGNTMIQIKQ